MIDEAGSSVRDAEISIVWLFLISVSIEGLMLISIFILL